MLIDPHIAASKDILAEILTQFRLHVIAIRRGGTYHAIMNRHLTRYSGYGIPPGPLLRPRS